MKQGLYTLGPETCGILIYTYKSGIFSILSQDLLIKAMNYKFDIEINNNSINKLNFDIDTNSLKAICAIIGEKHHKNFLTENDKNDIENKIKSKYILDANKYPAISFISTNIKEESDKYLVDGNLTIKDRTKLINSIFIKDIEKPNTKLTGHYSLYQTEFGIKPYTAMFSSLEIQNMIKIEWEINL
ncbi:YceI family protein [Candidatus Poribacteria bacterium]|nr:YceI family protein [Candidatus Poribacteria bacterium]